MASAAPLRVLFIAYRFPPQGGGGVQRPTKLIKAWSRNGASSAVLAGPGGVEAFDDPTLLNDLPAGLRLQVAGDPSPWLHIQRLRRRLRHAGYVRLERASGRVGEAIRQLSVPDGTNGWIPVALWSGLRMARRFAPDIVFVTGPPFTPFVVAASLARVIGRPLVLDYRDPWTASYVPRRKALLGDRLNPRIERGIVGRAAVISAAHRAIFRYLAPLLGRQRPYRLWVPNGYDPEDFDFADPESDRFFTLAHTGSFAAARRNPRVLIEVLEQMLDRGDLAPDRFVLRLAGTTEIVERLCRAESPLLQSLKNEGYVAHGQSVRFLRGSTVNLVMTDQGERNFYTPAKFYEALYAGRPVLLLSPEGVTTRLARRVGGCRIADPEDRGAIRGAVLDLYRRWSAEQPLPGPSPEKIRFYDRQHQAGRLLRVLRTVAAAEPVG